MKERKKGPGRYYRKGMSLIEAVQRFANEADAEAWFVTRRWPNGVQCVACDSDNIKIRTTRRQTPTYHCNSCKKDFTVKTGTIMHDSKLPLSKWALAFYLFSTSLKGVSSMKMHRDLGVTQKTAWHLAHRIREIWDDEMDVFAGPVEVDETYIGGKERNKHASRRLRAGRGPVGKTAVVGALDRDTGQIVAEPVESTDKPTLQGFVLQHTQPGASVFTDDARAYEGLPDRLHLSVRHSVGEYVREQAHTNGLESFWATLKRGYDGVYHKMSPKHLGRYVCEFSGRHNQRPLDTEEQMSQMTRGAIGKRLTYENLIA